MSPSSRNGFILGPDGRVIATTDAPSGSANGRLVGPSGQLLGAESGGSSPADPILALAPLAYWPMDRQAGGTTVEDVSGNGHTLTLSGNPGFVEGSHIVFNGVDVFGTAASIDSGAELPPASAQSIVLVSRLNITGMSGSSRVGMIDPGYVSGRNLAVTTNRVLGVTVGGGTTVSDGDSPVYDGGFHAYVGTWAFYQKLFVDGLQIGNDKTYGAEVETNGRTFVLGAAAAGFIDGDIKAVAVFDYELTPEQIATIVAGA